ncbi:MAG: WxcM-like domain-containing protein [Microbacteriaceae bacterium]|nr:MAG: WxcM-like domain-containing protein [Microbacteriaceae bacterium]
MQKSPRFAMQSIHCDRAMTQQNLSHARLVELAEFLDAKGSLVVAELGAQLPFDVKRVFVISGVPEGEPRGIHAHRECQQFLVCVSGSVKAMVDDGERREVLRLDRPSLGLHMPALTWGTQYDHSPDAVLLVLASHPYDPADYVHEYDEFLALTAV